MCEEESGVLLLLLLLLVALRWSEVVVCGSGMADAAAVLQVQPTAPACLAFQLRCNNALLQRARPGGLACADPTIPSLSAAFPARPRVSRDTLWTR